MSLWLSADPDTEHDAARFPADWHDLPDLPPLTPRKAFPVAEGATAALRASWRVLRGILRLTGARREYWQGSREALAKVAEQFLDEPLGNCILIFAGAAFVLLAIVTIIGRVTGY